MLIRAPKWMAVFAGGAVGLSGCAGEAGQATTTAPITRAPTTTMTVLRPRTVVELKSALLELSDLPSGYVLEPARDSGVDIGAASSKDPRCAPLVKLSNLKKAAGSTASANVTFAGGPSGPFVDESIDALGSVLAVEASQAFLKSAVAACRQLTIAVPGQGSFPMNIVEVPAPKVGKQSFATRMTAVGGPMDGLETTQVTAGSGDVLVSMTFVGADLTDVDDGTASAVGKAEMVLGGGP